jgi:hypothetical protein
MGEKLMGVYLYGYVEVQKPNGWEFLKGWSRYKTQGGEYRTTDDFCDAGSYKTYTLTSFLCDVRSDGSIIPLDKAGKGWPDNISKQASYILDDPDYFGLSWYTLRELLDAPWERVFSDLDVMVEDEVLYRIFTQDNMEKLYNRTADNSPDEIRFLFYCC